MTNWTRQFVVTSGTVIGREHVRVGRNNQDKVVIEGSEHVLAAVVADGCGSGKHSEVGATLIATWLANKCVADGARCDIDDDFLFSIQEELISYLQSTCYGLMKDISCLKGLVHDLFLSTVIAVVMKEGETKVFGTGDGVVSVNGVTSVYDSGELNRPDYIAYEVLRAHKSLMKIIGKMEFKTFATHQTRDVHSVLIGTDGAVEIENRAQEPLLNGQLPGSLRQFESEEKYAKNPSLLHKRLRVFGENNGRLSDDTTIALVRRVP